MPVWPTAANPPTLLHGSIDGTDGQTDGRTPYRYIYPAAVSTSTTFDEYIQPC